MSLETRQKLVDSGHIFFQDDSQKADLLSPQKTHTELIALLEHLVDLGFHIELTAVRSDHHDDSDLGEHCHANGWCVDCWPVNQTPGAYLNPENLPQFLHAIAASPYLYQVGLGGTAQTHENYAAAGSTVFTDSGSDHIHVGCHESI